LVTEGLAWIEREARTILTTSALIGQFVTGNEIDGDIQ
jgi:hypothetical protein